MKKLGMGRVVILSKLKSDNVPDARQQEIMKKLFG